MLYPLRFEPILRRYLWGGRRLGTELGKAIGAHDDYAESWELVDHGEDQSIVKSGPLAGRTLSSLFQEFGEAIFGQGYAAWTAQERPASLAQRFPLLFKFLDCHRVLSIQIHPNDAQARLQTPPDLGKTEAWIVMHASPGARVYAGLKPGTTGEVLRRAIDQGNLESVLHSFEPAVGDCIFVPAGTVHGLGAGFLVAEIQQASDTTFRLFDWNRVDAKGESRPLHIEQSLAVLKEPAGPVAPVVPQRLSSERERLVACEKFVLDRVTLRSPKSLGDHRSFHLIAVLDGVLRVTNDPTGEALRRGETMLLPAACGATDCQLESESATLLDISWPLDD